MRGRPPQSDPGRWSRRERAAFCLRCLGPARSLWECCSSAAGRSRLKGALRLLCGAFLTERSRHTIIATCAALGCRVQEPGADCVGLDLCSKLYLALCACVRAYACAPVRMCEHNVLQRARRVKYASVDACHKNQGRFDGFRMCSLCTCNRVGVVRQRHVCAFVCVDGKISSSAVYLGGPFACRGPLGHLSGGRGDACWMDCTPSKCPNQLRVCFYPLARRGGEGEGACKGDVLGFRGSTMQEGGHSPPGRVITMRRATVSTLPPLASLFPYPPQSQRHSSPET